MGRRLALCHCRKVLLLTVSGAAFLGAAKTAMKIAYDWHDSSQYSRVIVNATQGIEARPQEWFARDRLITDFEITNVPSIGREEAQKQYSTTRRQLEAYGLAVGTYISGISTMPEAEQTCWPPNTVPVERMPASARYSGSWPGMPHRKVIDVRDGKTCLALRRGILREWEQVPAAVRFVDNAAIHHSTGAGQDWSAYCANIKEIRAMGAGMGSRQIFNIAVHVGFMSDEETRQLMDAVCDHGIALEMPWHPNIRRSAVQTERARVRYRQLLDSGMGIVMMPIDGDPQQLVDWVRTWRKPADRLYISGAFYKAPDLQFFGPGK
jgi:hypothetical protein